MKQILLVILLIIGGTIPQAVYAGDTGNTQIKVGLATEQNQLVLNVADVEGLIDLSTAEPTTIPIPGDQIVITSSGNNIAVNFVPISSGPLVVVPGQTFLNWNSHNYRGVFIITASNNHLNLVERLDLEDYLRGVVPREVMADWPMSVLKAQAIAARTYSIASLGRHNASLFDLCPTDHCQVYGGVDSERPNTDKAVAETNGKIITYRGKVIAALYHAASGGYTADAADVWSTNVPYLKPVIDWDQNSPYAQWTKYMNWEDLQALVSKAYPVIGRLKHITAASFSKDGKLQKIILKGDLGETTITGEQFRFLAGLSSSRLQFGIIYGPEPNITLWWNGNSVYPQAMMPNKEIPGLTADILSPAWDLYDPFVWLQDKEPIRIVVKGSGWGHGVGLSQWGAKGMADNGFNELQILEHYYPGVTIMDLGKVKTDGSRP